MQMYQNILFFLNINYKDNEMQLQIIFFLHNYINSFINTSYYKYINVQNSLNKDSQCVNI